VNVLKISQDKIKLAFWEVLSCMDVSQYNTVLWVPGN
jgi:hypothetical protein